MSPVVSQEVQARSPRLGACPGCSRNSKEAKGVGRFGYREWYKMRSRVDKSQTLCGVSQPITKDEGFNLELAREPLKSSEICFQSRGE